MWHGCLIIIIIIIITPQGGIISRRLYNLSSKPAHFWEWKVVLWRTAQGYRCKSVLSWAKWDACIFIFGYSKHLDWLKCSITSERPGLNPWFCHLLAVRSWPNHLISLHLSSLLCYVYLRGILWELNEMMQVKYSGQNLTPHKQLIKFDYHYPRQIEGITRLFFFPLSLCQGSGWGYARWVNVRVGNLAEQGTWEMSWLSLQGSCFHPYSQNVWVTQRLGAGLKCPLGDFVPRQPQEELDSGV